MSILLYNTITCMKEKTQVIIMIPQSARSKLKINISDVLLTKKIIIVMTKRHEKVACDWNKLPIYYRNLLKGELIFIQIQIKLKKARIDLVNIEVQISKITDY